LARCWIINITIFHNAVNDNICNVFNDVIPYVDPQIDTLIKHELVFF